MALSATQVNEVRGSAGSDTLNGGGFNPASANFMTDGVISAANTASPVLSSATYTFVAGDVNAWVLVKSATNATPQWAQIASVAGGAATLKAAVGQGVLYDSTATFAGLSTVAGVGTTSSLSSVTFGVDYSQQNAVQTAISGATTSAANAIILTASATKAMLGNVVQITGGTNFTTGFYEVTAVSAGVSLTVDRTCTSAAGSAGVVKVGGALATMAKVNGFLVAGMINWLNGAVAETTSFTIVAGTKSAATFIRGYGTYRGDGYQGRTGNTKGLVTTNMPSWSFSSGQHPTPAGFQYYENLNLSGSFGGGFIAFPGNATVKACVVTNTIANSSSSAMQVTGQFVWVTDCDIICNGSSANAGLQLTNNTTILGCHITCPHGFGVLSSGCQPTYESCLIYASVTGAACTGAAGVLNLCNCTIVGNSGDGVNVGTGANNLTYIYGCMITDNGGAGINCVINTNAVSINFNFFRNNTSGNLTNSNALSKGSLSIGNNIQAAGGSAYVDYVSQATGDYSLAATSPALSGNQPYKSSYGCFQYQSSGGGGAKSYAMVG